MTVDMLDGGTILVNMCESDMQDYTLSLSDKADREEQGLIRLLQKISELCGLDSRSKSYLVEALPTASGCLLIISVHYIRRKYRIKRTSGTTVCRFFDIDSMLDFRRIFADRMGYSLYLYGGKYIMLPQPFCKTCIRELSEYGEIISADSILMARIREYGKLVEKEEPRLLGFKTVI